MKELLEPTIFVKYNESGTSSESVEFPDGEVLILEESLTYGNTTLNCWRNSINTIFRKCFSNWFCIWY